VKWFFVGNSAEKISLIEATFHRRYKSRTSAGSGSSPKLCLMQFAYDHNAVVNIFGGLTHPVALVFME
jgi:hypothetical protein